MKKCLILSLVIFAITACEPPRELPPTSFFKWVSNKSNGLIKTREIKNVQLEAKYLPADFLAYKEFSSEHNTLDFDSVRSAYKCALSFHVKISADAQHPEYGNLMQYKISSREEMMARLQYLSFRIPEFLHLHQGSKKYEPVLSHFEGFDQVGNSIRFQVSYVVDEFACGTIQPEFTDLTLTWDDPFWDLGTNNFLFPKNMFQEIPKLKL